MGDHRPAPETEAGLTIDLTVNDGDTGKSIDKFGVICHLETRRDGGYSSADYRIRHQGTHPHGRLMIPGVLRGRNHLVVVPREGHYAMSTARFLDVQGEGTIGLVVALFPPARRPVLVTTEGNEAVVGTKLQLVERATDHPIDAETILMKRVGRTISTSAPNCGWLAHETKTSAKGDGELIGQRNGVYALRPFQPQMTSRDTDTETSNRPVRVTALFFQARDKVTDPVAQGRRIDCSTRSGRTPPCTGSQKDRPLKSANGSAAEDVLCPSVSRIRIL